MLANNLKKITSNSGTALISALFIMTLITIVVTALSSRIQALSYRTTLLLNTDKLYLASELTTFWAMAKISKLESIKVKNDQGLILKLPKHLKNYYPTVGLQSNLYDLQGRFNLNNLIDKFYLPVFLNLLDRVIPTVAAEKRDAIAAATQLWISAYAPGRGHDELMNYYLRQKPPYYAGYQLFKNISEFRLVRGVTPEIYQSLEPYLTALPETTKINLASISPELFKSLSSEITAEKAEEFFKLRLESEKFTVKILGELIQKYKLPASQVGMESFYFMNIGTATNQDLTLSNTTILKLSKSKNGQLSASIISEEIGS